MPTAATYWSAAADFDGLAAHRANEARRLGAKPLDVAQGAFAGALERALDEVAAGLGTSAIGYAALADECRRRAAACEAYDAELRAYLAAVARDREVERTPPRREPWMTPS